MNSGILFLLSVCFSAAVAYEDVTLTEYISSHSYLYFDNLVRQSGLTELLSQTGKVYICYSLSTQLN